jgi:hypothetical protein
MTTVTAAVTLFGETREIEFRTYGQRCDSVAAVVVGRFPTGTKLHRSTLTLWKRQLDTGRTLRGETAAVVDGDEYVADFTLYTHNRNVGRITGWCDVAIDDPVVSKWGRAL